MLEKANGRGVCLSQLSSEERCARSAVAQKASARREDRLAWRNCGYIKAGQRGVRPSLWRMRSDKAPPPAFNAVKCIGSPTHRPRSKKRRRSRNGAQAHDAQNRLTKYAAINSAGVNETRDLHSN